MEWSPGIIQFFEKSCRGIFTLDFIVCLEEQPWCGGQGFFGLLRKAAVKWSQEIDLFVKKSSREMVTQYSFAFVSLYLHLEKQSCYSFPEFRTRSIDNCFTLICMQKRESSCFFLLVYTKKYSSFRNILGALLVFLRISLGLLVNPEFLPAQNSTFLRLEGQHQQNNIGPPYLLLGPLKVHINAPDFLNVSLPP